MVQVKEKSGAGGGRNVATKAPVLCIDAGNGYFKMDFGGKRYSFVAAVKELSDREIEDSRPDRNSALVTLNGATYAFGALARDLGGKSLFEAGKVENTPIAIAAALALAGLAGGQVAVRLLVPDSGNFQWKKAAAGISNTVADFHASVFRQGFERFQPTVTVELVTEGYPVWNWAVETAQIPQELEEYPLTGIIDAGTGELTCSVWSKSGTIIRTAGKSGQVSFVAPAMKELAGAIAAGFSFQVKGQTPDRASILDIIRRQGSKPPADRRYVYEQAGEACDFTDLVESTVKRWRKELFTQLMNDNWSAIWNQIGMVYIVGGASDMLAPLEEATKGRFKVVRLPGVEPQLVNAALMAQMG